VLLAQRAKLLNVFGTAHERHRDVVDPDGEAVLQVLLVFRREGAEAHTLRRKVHAHARANAAAVLDTNTNALPLHANHTQLDVAVAKDDAIALPHVVGETVVLDGDGALVARVTGHELDRVAGFNRRRTRLRRANLGTAEILKDRHRLSELLALAANDVRASPVLFPGTVREI
jgi:hypothetical protein